MCPDTATKHTSRISDNSPNNDITTKHTSSVSNNPTIIHIATKQTSKRFINNSKLILPLSTKPTSSISNQISSRKYDTK